MPGLYESQIFAYHSARAIPISVWEKIASNIYETNILAAHLYKTLSDERDHQPTVPDQLWIVTSSLIASCDETPMGTRPLFIVPLQPGSHESDALFSDIERLADELLKHVLPQRIFSVFGPEHIVAAFANTWSRKTAIYAYTDPYYAAKLTYVTLQTLSSNQSAIVQPGFKYELRRAGEDDIEEVASLCHGFAKESAPFTLSYEESMIEAQLVVRGWQCWLHRISQDGGPSEIACIVVVGRDTGPVAAINKVYTNPKWRSRKCAERLVRYVCKTLLVHKEKVILFVAHDNDAANKVYDRVGFVGLNKEAGSSPLVRPWLEIGFDRDIVHLGHW